ncbi:hypothetical protein FQN55_009396 [Onygenales sp. PD_40]|nr:hypothetical protein FQN55_009396 [Onygenales sp. PD_40]KAK2795596.1 hypothetical protein FQN51_000450 [Onygenales sp. PD_10]
MTTVSELPAGQVEYDYIIVGGGTAGCVVASRLAEALPQKLILVIEGGPSDFGVKEIESLSKLAELWGGEYDYNYTSVEQLRGNSNILHSRAKVLGGCSSHNGGISLQPFAYDSKRWQESGAKGWTHEEFVRLAKKVRLNINPIAERHQNPIMKDWLEACAKTWQLRKNDNWNDYITQKGNIHQICGFIPVAHNPEDRTRSSASTAYIHPILRGEEKRPNLTILLNAWVSRLNVVDDDVKGVHVTLKSGRKLDISAKVETVLCAGTIDTPRLMLLSGIGPRDQLESLKIPVVKDIPGVGENLMDHPEGIIFWELNKAIPDNHVMLSEAAMFLRREAPNANGDDGAVGDVLIHTFVYPFYVHTSPLGYEEPKNVFCLLPNIPRSRSRGRIYLTSADPSVKPALDFRYFTDPEGYDEKTLVFSLKAARLLAQTSPFKEWIKREVAPGPNVQTDAELSEYGRKTANTVYHPCGTTKIGDFEKDPLAVVDHELRVRGLRNLRIADAGVFPVITSINPMLTVLSVGEKMAELLIAEARQTGSHL